MDLEFEHPNMTPDVGKGTRIINLCTHSPRARKLYFNKTNIRFDFNKLRL